MECGGIEPGVIPPISAWWPLLATKNTGFSTSLLKIARDNRIPNRCDDKILIIGEEILVKDRSDDGKVGKMGSPCQGMIRENYVPPLEFTVERLHLVLDCLLHGAQVHGYVRGVGNEAAVRSENRAREIQPLLDIRRDGGTLKDPSSFRCIKPVRLLLAASCYSYRSTCPFVRRCS